ncbi:MAG: sugar kinase [Thermoguttaceae bacterium]|nr:sugar kinase [Thermoguttaceae bacterium]
MAKIITYGEMMIRLAPEGFLRYLQAFPGKAELTFGGAEANVAVSMAMLGDQAAFVTALPRNDLALAALATLRGLNVDVSGVVQTDQGRFGIYFIEMGANQRASNVIYDRAGSSVAVVDPQVYAWEKLFDGFDWFHVSGITPALSQQAADATLQAAQTAHRKGLTVSLDLNFRKKLWKWDMPGKPRDLARQTMTQILPFVDVLVANESDCHDVLGVQAENSDAERGKLDISRYPEVAAQVAKLFPNLKKIAITLRESISASHNNWGGMLYDVTQGKANFAPVDAQGVYHPYEIRNIVDRVGGGDSFASGLIHALAGTQYRDNEQAIAFAVAASCLAHSVYGDLNYVKEAEVVTLMSGNASGRVQR